MATPDDQKVRDIIRKALGCSPDFLVFTLTYAEMRALVRAAHAEGGREVIDTAQKKLGVSSFDDLIDGLAAERGAK